MKKLLLIFMLLMTNSYAEDMNFNVYGDIALQKMGLIDEDYKYTDIKAVAEFFRDGSNKIAISLPLMLNNEIEVTAVLYTPYQAMFSYTLQDNLDEYQIKAFNGMLYSPESIKNYCNTTYVSKFLKANGFVAIYDYNDLTGKDIGRVTIRPSMCD